MERHNRELRRREKLGTVWTERNLLALLQKQGLNNQPPKTKRYPSRQVGRSRTRSGDSDAAETGKRSREWTRERVTEPGFCGRPSGS